MKDEIKTNLKKKLKEYGFSIDRKVNNVTTEELNNRSSACAIFLNSLGRETLIDMANEAIVTAIDSDDSDRDFLMGRAMGIIDVLDFLHMDSVSMRDNKINEDDFM